MPIKHEVEACPALRRASSSEQDEDEELLDEMSLLRGAPPMVPAAQLPMIKEGRRLSASEPQASKLLGFRLEHEVREGISEGGPIPTEHEVEVCLALLRSSSSEKGEDEGLLESLDNMLLPESLLRGAPPMVPAAQLPIIKEERRPSASELQASKLLGFRLEHEVREAGAAFDCLAKLATRKGSPLRPVAPQEENLQSSLSSLPWRILVPGERCKPPYSREWLLAHRARCGGSPLRPTALHPTELLSLLASVAAPALDTAPTTPRVVAPTYPQPASHAASALAAAGAAGAAAKPLPEDDTTPNSIHALLATLEET